jgi:hypothetical protein
VLQRIDKSWTVLESLETEDGMRCVDLFRRPDGSFGYEEFRRDPEDQGGWTPLRFASGLSHRSEGQARAAAQAAVVWLADMTPSTGRAAP